MAEQDTLIEFPCDFPIKVMGEQHQDFQAEVVRTIQSILPVFTSASVQSRASSGGKYTSLTCEVHVTSKPQLDSIYMALTSHPMVKVVL